MFGSPLPELSKIAALIYKHYVPAGDFQSNSVQAVVV